jgi:ABC transporter with metal-binding/Fe-S-binding domain ATP-binding protein
MFHTPNVHLTPLQAEALGLPLVVQETGGTKEEELEDLRRAVEKARDNHGVEGVVSGAIESAYQAERIQRVCRILDLWCFNPLWKRDQHELLSEIERRGYEVIVSGVFAFPFDESWLGRMIDAALIESLRSIEAKYKISPSGEGGEIETTVLCAPFFRKKIEILSAEKICERHAGVFAVREARLVGK